MPAAHEIGQEKHRRGDNLIHWSPGGDYRLELVVVEVEVPLIEA
ncbi:MAG TPA: hypothetical protein VNZ53_31980 [Steroidobacteraceae bacterium]|nr:hypothetical protein [Steroidobacteraceae bacterium]